ncbi:MAG: DNA-processing protein DprA, partial [Sciscionella sp.]
AYGIDGAGHRGALAGSGRTVAVLGCGVDVPYPAGHAGLLDAVAERGLVLSEYPPGTPPARHRFLVRNRVIAALGCATVVVEAGRRSGARNTALTSAALGRPVLAVPGSIHSALSVGCHQLLREGIAVAATSVGDVVELASPMGEGLGPLEEPTKEPRKPPVGGPAQLVLDAMGYRSARSVPSLTVQTGLPVEKVTAVLVEWELRGELRRVEAGWLRVTRSERGDA